VLNKFIAINTTNNNHHRHHHGANGIPKFCV